MKIRTFPRPPRGNPVTKPGAVEPVIPQISALDWDRSMMRRRKKDSSVKRRRETLLRTIAIGVVAIFGLIGVVYVGLTRDRSASAAVWRDPNSELFTPREQAVTPLSEDQALGLVKKVLAARSAAEISESVRLRDISASEAVQFLTELGQKRGKVSRMEWIGNMDANGIQIEGVEIYFENESSRPLRALLTPNERSVWQVDLAALSAACSKPWEKVVSEAKIQADLRVFIAHDNYYNGRFLSEREWAAYTLVNPDSDNTLIGYCQRGSETQRVLDASLKSSRAIRAIVRVRKNDPAPTRLCEIISFLAEDWILTDTAFDERQSDGASKVTEGP